MSTLEPEADVVLSIVVPTLNRAELLRDCLVSLLDDPSTTPVEVIVVDNGSIDATPSVVREVAASRTRLRYVLEPSVGLSHAKNRGIRESAGDVVAFIDDDIIVDPGWADAIIAPFEDESVGIVGGRILPRWPVPLPSWLNGDHSRILNPTDAGAQSGPYGEVGAPTGANMAVRVAALSDVEGPPFDPTLGNTGSIAIGREETYLLEQIAKSWAIYYQAEAIVHHRVLARRMSMNWLRAAYFDRGRGEVIRDRLAGRPPSQSLLGAFRVLAYTARIRTANEVSREQTAHRAGRELWAYERLGAAVEAWSPSRAAHFRPRQSS